LILKTFNSIVQMARRLPLSPAVRTKLIRGEIMGAKFDIFKKLPDGHPLWVKAVEGLEEAKNQLARLAANSPGEYFIYSVRNGRVIHAMMAPER
jgi:hypothetical protein